MITFIGLGAQKSGTSWLYSCLYEHPDICAPQKELHFFSRQRYEKGIGWYEKQFGRCKEGEVLGEFSTSYLYTPGTVERIIKHYPNAKLIAVVRNPIDRAYSQYRNAIKAGEISKRETFEEYVEKEPSAKDQGLYGKQLHRYFKYVSSQDLLVLVYEDFESDPLAIIKTMYEHIGVDPEFIPKSLRSRVNEARTPRFVWLDRLMHKLAELLRKIGLDKIVWFVKQSGATDKIRGLNSEPEPNTAISEEVRKKLVAYYRDDVEYLSNLLHRNLSYEWNINHEKDH